MYNGVPLHQRIRHLSERTTKIQMYLINKNKMTSYEINRRTHMWLQKKIRNEIKKEREIKEIKHDANYDKS